MRTAGFLKPLSLVFMLLVLFNSITITSTANSGAGIDFVDPDPTIYTVTFYSNDERVDTTLAQIQITEGNIIGTAGMPHNPIRPGYIFEGWNTMPAGTGLNVTASTVVNSNLSVFAQWTALLPTPAPTFGPTPTEPQTEPPVPPLPLPPPAPLSPAPPFPLPPLAPLPPAPLFPLPPPDLPLPEAPPPEAPQEQPPPPQEQPEPDPPDVEIDITELEIPYAPIELDETTPPRTSIFGRQFLLFALPEVDSWALLNLLMSIAGIILVVITVIRLLAHKIKEDKKVHDRISNSSNEDFENPENNDPSKKFRLTWFAAGAVAALTAVIVFLLTQDITAIIALADWWTIIHIAILTVVAVSYVVVFKGKKSAQDNEKSKDDNTHNPA